jgi:5-methyltetrahydrofolate--homocysteine methyltransferase
VTAGDAVTELMAQLERDGEFAEQLFTHGLGVQTAEGMAEWLHWRARRDLGIPATQGRRYSWGYPAIPEQSEHEKVSNLLGLGTIGMRLTSGYAPEPEQSTLALIAHHPEAIYFGTTSGRLLPDGHKGRADDVIKDSPRDPSRFGVLGDAELEFAAAE